jgi:hypothetical protein
MAQFPDPLSLCFRNQDYTLGAAHYNHGYFTLNINLAKRSLINGNELLRLYSEKDKTDFCEIANATDSHGCGVLATDDLEPGLQCYVTKGALVICFSDFEKCPGDSIIVLPSRKIIRFLAPGIF